MAIATSLSFNRLVRFKDEHGNILYGESPEEATSSLVGSLVQVYNGKFPWDPAFKITSKKSIIKQVLAPLPHVPIFVCVGLNYKAHAKENETPLPKYPILFNKPSASLAGPEEDIPIHRSARFLDYEGELCVIIGKDCKDLSETDNPLDYVLGYTVGNDVSSRFWQHPDNSGQQAGFSKGFDKFAPIGPVICSTRQISDIKKSVLVTYVNKEERQRSGLDDMIFDVESIIRFISTGRTVERGTVIMTGTPSGVAAFRNPPDWLKDGDLVEVEITGIGKIRNKVVFEESLP